MPVVISDTFNPDEDQRSSRSFRPSHGSRPSEVGRMRRSTLDSGLRSSTFFGDDVETVTEPIAQQPQIPWHVRWNQYGHLAFFAFLGCWMRIRLEKDTQEGGLANPDTAIFADICGNILGSFTIGALTTSTALGRGDRNVAIFPASWIGVQNNSELQLGINCSISLN
jgi:hypothetical protein